MEQLVQYLGLGWVGSVLGIVGIVLSVWFYIKSVRTPIPAAAIESIRLVGDAGSALPEEVTVLYHSQPVPRLTRSTVRFWNAGNLTLDGSSVATRDPIRLELESDATFLSVNITKLTREVTQLIADVSPTSPNQIIIKFDFLDPTDGAIIECLHTGNELSPTIEGVIKGIPKGVSLKDMSGYKVSKGTKKKLYFRLTLGIGTIVIGFLILLGAIFVPTAQITKPISGATRFYYGLAMGVVYIGLGAYILNGFRRPFPKGLTLPAAEELALKLPT